MKHVSKSKMPSENWVGAVSEVLFENQFIELCVNTEHVSKDISICDSIIFLLDNIKFIMTAKIKILEYIRFQGTISKLLFLGQSTLHWI